MGEPATAMRDPIFYRFHAFCDDIFQEHKNTLPEYSVQQVSFLIVEIYLINLTHHLLFEKDDGRRFSIEFIFWNLFNVLFPLSL